MAITEHDIEKLSSTTVPRIYVATSNPGKLADFASAAESHGIEISALPNMGQISPPEESGSTFEENARLKADYYSQKVPGEIVVVDDSGLVVNALGGEPGVRSARYAEDAGLIAPDVDQANNGLLLQRMEGVPDGQRCCAFVCVIAAARNGKTLQTFRAEARGTLLREARGSNGFGYDPLFYFPSLGKSFAELSRAEKLKVSHRGAAFQMFLDWMEVIFKSS